MTRDHRALAIISLLYLGSVIGFALSTPYGEAPDEFDHLLYVEHLVRFATLPPIGAHPYTNEAVQPPLYYLLAASAVRGVRAIRGVPNPAAPLAPPVRGNPRFPSLRHHGIQALLHPANERWPPWPYALRGLSILYGLGLVLFTYRTARLLVPAPAPGLVALASSAFAALLPEANSIRGSVSSENLADLLGAWVLALLVEQLLWPPSRRRVAWIGLALGLGALTKLTLVVLGPLALLVLVLARRRAWRGLAADLLLAAIVVAVVAGPFYVLRWVAYGDPLALAAWRTMVPSDHPGRFARHLLWLDLGQRETLWTSFWGRYGWLMILLPAWVYNTFAALALLAVAGLLRVSRWLTAAQRAGAGVLGGALVLLLGLITLYSDVVLQGRELFAVLSAICVLLGLGAAGLVAGRGAVQSVPSVGRWSRRIAACLVPGLVAGLFALNVYSIVALVGPLLNTR